MIYLFSGCQTVCSLPGLLCTECSKVCKQLNCKPIARCCTDVGKACSQFTEKPLSSFVIIAALMGILELYCCFGALSVENLDECTWPREAQASFSIWLMVQIGFALLNIVFAPWFQHQVWEEIMHSAAAGGAAMTAPKQVLDKSVVQAGFKKVFLEDFSVLVYFLAMLASFAWSWLGSHWLRHGGDLSCDSATEGQALWAAWIGQCFFLIAFAFTFTWYCCACCASSVRLSQPVAEYGHE